MRRNMFVESKKYRTFFAGETSVKQYLVKRDKYIKIVA